MLEERIIELIHRELDRDTDENERMELHARLESDPDARLYFEEMLGLAQLLEQTPSSEPPSDFAAAVMQSVRAHASSEPSPWVASQPFSFLHGRFAAIRVGVALAAVLLIAFILAPSLFRSLDSSHLGGIMLEPSRAVEPKSWSVPAGEAGTIRVAATDERVSLRLDSASDSPLVADVSFDAAATRVESLAGAVREEADPGHVRLSIRGGSAVVTFVRLTPKPVSFAVDVTGAGGATLSRRIEIPAAANF